MPPLRAFWMAAQGWEEGYLQAVLFLLPASEQL